MCGVLKASVKDVGVAVGGWRGVRISLLMHRRILFIRLAYMVKLWQHSLNELS